MGVQRRSNRSLFVNALRVTFRGNVEQNIAGSASKSRWDNDQHCSATSADQRVGAKEVRCYRSLEVDIHMITSLIRKTPTSLRQFKDAYSPW